MVQEQRRSLATPLPLAVFSSYWSSKGPVHTVRLGGPTTHGVHVTGALKGQTPPTPSSRTLELYTVRLGKSHKHCTTPCPTPFPVTGPQAKSTEGAGPPPAGTWCSRAALPATGPLEESTVPSLVLLAEVSILLGPGQVQRHPGGADPQPWPVLLAPTPGGPGLLYQPWMPRSKMPAWVILPITLPAFTITGMWIVYAMALSNNHICPVTNWIYNQSCEFEESGSCCTLDHIPLVSKCGNLPPESCFFSLICSLGSFMVMIVGLLRYAYVIEHYGPSLLNTVSFALGWICAAGLTMVGNFQVDHAKVLHYIGAGVAFPTSMLFICMQSLLTYRMAHTRSHYWTGHLRSLLTSVGLVTIVLSGVFFIQESVLLQHVAALCEWIFIINVLIFYGTFAFEFGAITTETFLVLLKASRAPKSYKSDSSTATTPHTLSTSENLAMI